MKQLKLLLAAGALMLATGISAQTWTDKTSVITNPSFETDAAISDLKSCGWATNRATGWTITPSSPGNAQVGVGNSSSTIQGIASTFSPSAGEKYFYMRENWNANTTFSVSQEIQSDNNNIPAGFYRLTVKAAMFSSVASTYTLSLQEEGQTAATNSFSYAGSANNENWRDWSVLLYKQADNTELTITAAYKTPSENSGGKHYCLLLDDVKLEYLSPSDVSSTTPFDITCFIKNPGFENNSGDGWNITSTYTNWGANAIANGNKQQWNGNFSVSQELPKLPNGVYELGVQGFYRPGGNDSQLTDQNAVLYAVGDQEVTSPLMLVSAGGNNSQDNDNGYTTAFTGVDPNVYVPNSQGDAEKVFAAGGYSDNSLRVTVTNGKLTIGVKKETLINNDWTVIDNFSLKYLGTDLLLQEVIAAWNTAHATLEALDATLLPDAAENAITTELAKECPNTEADIVAATEALQALIDSYDGIKAAYAEYKALKAQVEDLKNTDKYDFTGTEALSTFNTALSTIDGNAENATDATTLTALLPDLKTAGNTFVGGIESNDGFDLTYNIGNNSFETGALTPWTTNGSSDTGVKPNSDGTYTTAGVDGDYLFNTWNDGAGSKVSQTLSDLPKGYYTVTALVASDAGNSINILAGSTTKIIDADRTDGKSKFVEGTTDKTLVSNGTLEIGANSTSWYKADNFRLTFYTETAGAHDAWLAAKTAAEVARDNVDYKNVTGEERAALLTEIAEEEPSTAEAYGTATTALQEATTTFTNAKSYYDAFVAAANTAAPNLQYASADKKTAWQTACAATPTSAQDAQEKTATITKALRAYYESHALAEGVEGAVNISDIISAANADSNTGWTNGIGTNQGQGYTDADNNVASKYLDGGWAANAGANIDMTREVELPAGKYLLTVTARGSVDLTEYKLSIAGQTIDLPHIGNAGGVFNNGWNDASIEFESDGTPLTLEIKANSTASQQWISLNRFRLVRLNLYAEMAGAAEYAALNAAIEAVEGNTLGFMDGEYAPYNNIAALQTLAAAKAIDQEAENPKDDITAMTASLNDAVWTANSGEVSAIDLTKCFDGTTDGSNRYYALGWGKNGGTDAYNTRIISGTEGNPGMAAVDNEQALFTKFGTTYGTDLGYTMPLAANTLYKFTFKYGAFGENKEIVTNLALASEDGETTVSISPASFTRANNSGLANSDPEAWFDYVGYFKIEDAGNYVLTLTKNDNGQQRQIVMGNISILSCEAIEIDEGQKWNSNIALVNVPVALKRTIKPGWNTVVLPFALTDDDIEALGGGESSEAYTVSTYDAETENLTFAKQSSILANTPFFLYAEAGGNQFSFTGKTLVSITGNPVSDFGDGAGSLIGSYAAYITVPYNEDGSTNYVLSNGNFYSVNSDVNLRNTRFYISIAGSIEANTLGFIIDGEANAINGIASETVAPEGIYNLQGQKVNAPVKGGIYIINGKKTLVK